MADGRKQNVKIHKAFGNDCSSTREKKKTDIHRISVIFFQLFFHVKLDNRLYFSENFNIWFPSCLSLTAPYKLKLILLFSVSDKMGITLLQAAALTRSGGVWWHQHRSPGTCSCESTCPVCHSSGLQHRTPNDPCEHSPSREKYIFKTPAMRETWDLHAVPQRPEKIVKGILKGFLTLLEHLNFPGPSFMLHWEPWEGCPGSHHAGFPGLWAGLAGQEWFLALCVTQVCAPPVLNPPKHGPSPGARSGQEMFSLTSLS